MHHWRNTAQSYGSVAKFFHWLIAIGIVIMAIVGFVMVNLANSPTKFQLFTMHKSTGVLLFGLIILRWLWRLSNPVPELPKTLSPWHRWLGERSNLVLYFMLFLMPLSGYVLSDASNYPLDFYNLFTIPPFLNGYPFLVPIAVNIHVYGAYVLVGLLVLHIGAAFYHHFILKNNVLLRMIPYQKINPKK